MTEAKTRGITYQLIFMDFSMPLMDGIECVTRIRKFYNENLIVDNQPSIIGVTGHVQKGFMQNGLKAGMDQVEHKPFYLSSVKKVMQKYYRPQLIARSQIQM